MLVEQALHGYVDGHRQIAASIRLDTESSRQLAMASDLSSVVRESFDGYLNGYFLEEAELFVFAKTWFAHEVQRPGAVWTHSLLVRRSDLGDIEHLGTLRTLFRRPPLLSFQAYCETVDLEPIPWESAEPRVGSATRFAAILEALFNAEDTSVVVKTESASEWEDEFLDIWSMLWPEMRSRFSFATSSSEARNIGGRPFDLLAVPQSAITQVSRRMGIGRAVVPDDVGRDTWALLLAFALERRQAAIPDFFRAFGPSLTSNRIAVRTLALLLVALSGSYKAPSDGIDSLVSVISTIKPGVGREYIASGLLDPTMSRWPPLDDPDLLEGLLLSSTAGNLEPESLRISERTYQTLRRRGIEWFVRILQHAPPGRDNLWAEVIKAVARYAADDRSMNLVSILPQEVLPDVIGYRSELLDDIDEAVLDDRRWWQIADAIISAQEVSDTALRKILAADLRRSSGRYAEKVFKREPELAAEVLLHEIVAQPRGSIDMLPAEYEALLSENFVLAARAALRGGDRDELTYRVLCEVLAHSSRSINEEERRAVWEVGNRAASASAFPAALLYVIAGLRENASPEFLIYCFQVIHDFLSRDMLPSWHWNLLQPRLPDLGPWDNWDKARRFRMAVVRQFLDMDWKFTQLITVLEPYTTQQLRSTLRWDFQYSRKAAIELTEIDR